MDFFVFLLTFLYSFLIFCITSNFGKVWGQLLLNCFKALPCILFLPHPILTKIISEKMLPFFRLIFSKRNSKVGYIETSFENVWFFLQKKWDRFNIISISIYFPSFQRHQRSWSGLWTLNILFRMVIQNSPRWFWNWGRGSSQKTSRCKQQMESVLFDWH